MSSKERLKVRYLPTYLAIILPVGIGHLIVWMQQSKSLIQVMRQRGYWPAVVLSCLLGLLVVGYEQRMVKHLDERFPWEDNFRKRLKKQLVYGIALPLVMILCCMSVYFGLQGVSMIHRKYLQIEFPVAFLLLSGLNVYYFGWYHRCVARHRLHSTPVEEVPKAEERNGSHPRQLLLVAGNTHTAVRPENVICFVNEDRIGGAFLITGELVGFQLTMTELKAMLDPEVFIQTNRWTIVNLDQVCTYNRYADRSGELYFKDAIPSILEHMEPDETRLFRIASGKDRMKKKYLINRCI